MSSNLNVPAKILVVDDTEMNRDMLSTLVEADGHKALLAENGRIGLEMLKAEPFDLVLLDVMMPEMNGYQVLEQLKADESLRSIPVIVLSALDEIGSVVRCIELGAEDYLPKRLPRKAGCMRSGRCRTRRRRNRRFPAPARESGACRCRLRPEVSSP
jgi:CheY-like chemotaxis protein